MERLRVSPNERVDIADFRAGAGGDLVLADLLRMTRGMILPSNRLTGSTTGSSARVLSGFSIPAAAIGTGTATLSRGVAIAALYEGGQLVFGLLTGEEAPASFALDFSSTGIGNYRVYVRAVATDATFQNRVFWNPSATPEEFVSNVPTRRVQTWEATFQDAAAAPPGHGEWFPVADIGVAVANVIGSIDDLRHLFFEGNPALTYAAEWGDGTDDRDPDRALYGIGDFHRWVQFVRRQIADIIGSSSGPAALAPTSLTELAFEHYGTSYGVDAGRHKAIITGDTARWWVIDTSVDALADMITFLAADSPVGAFLKTSFSQAGDDANVYINPRGANPLNVADIIKLWFGPAATGAKIGLYKAAADEYLFSFSTTDPSGAYIRVGAGALKRGFEAQINANFWTDWKTIRLILPWNCLSERPQVSEWGLICGAGGGISVVSGNMMLQQYAPKVNDPVFFEFHDFPEGGTLNSIRICWKQDAVAGTPSAMYAARYIIAQESPGDVVGDAPIIRRSLKAAAPADRITYDAATGVSRITEFVCDQNNVQWSRQKDKLVIGVMSGDGGADRLAVYWIQMEWGFETANPWPVAAI